MRVQLSFTTVSEARRRLLRSEFCGLCGKLLLRDEADARSYIGLLLRNHAPRSSTFALAPYRCGVQRGWHVGPNPQTLALDFSAGRAIVPSEGAHAR